MNPTYKPHWPSILILIAFAISAAFIFLIAAILGVGSLMDMFSPDGDPAGGMIISLAFGFEFLLLGVCAAFVLQKAIGRDSADRLIRFPYARWQILLVLGLIFVAVLLGTLAVNLGSKWLAWLFLPILTLFVIVPPLWLVFGLGTRGIQLGPRWQVFSVFGLAMTVGPALMTVLEVLLLVGLIVLAGVFIALRQPDLFAEIMRLGKLLEHETDPAVLIRMTAPYFQKPAFIWVVLGYIALLVPMIEELFKPLAVWVFARKLSSPAQGFALGMLSGAAFALVESLNASGDGSMSWPVIVLVRAGTGLLHMTASGLVGWGIASAFQQKRILRLPAAYFAAVAIHGVWNACAVGLGFASLGESIGRPEWLAQFAPALLGGMLVLGPGMLIVLVACNRKLQAVEPMRQPLQEVQ
ncbi:MAG: PrsW family intramembrane metalloprotease [Chloroflexi bacterium]|nr:PrsW family intramembrane metalloprotease [Chloroflexota bacterium]